MSVSTQGRDVDPQLSTFSMDDTPGLGYEPRKDYVSFCFRALRDFLRESSSDKGLEESYL